MHMRLQPGTDIAQIGLWDAAHRRPDLKHVKYADYLTALRNEARSGRLFYINTGGDGEFPLDIFVDEAPEPAWLAAYMQLGHTFLISSPSGRLNAGGLEDFVEPIEDPAPQDGEVTLPSGHYALTLYQLDEEKLADDLKRSIGTEDFQYYERAWSGPPWGCLIFVAAMVSLLLRLWLVGGGILCGWVAYIFFRARMRASDVRFQDIARRVEAYENRFPNLVVVLTRVSSQSNLEGGWYDLC